MYARVKYLKIVHNFGVDGTVLTMNAAHKQMRTLSLELFIAISNAKVSP